MTNKITLLATVSFGMEAVVKRELQALGFNNVRAATSKVEFEAEIADIPRANLWLRAADRVLLKMAEFKALTFDELFEQTKDLPWEDWITEKGKFTVIGKARNSQLGSVRACQSIVKKAVVERLKGAYDTDWLEESGAEYTIKVAMLNDTATLTIDTSGSGLHKRGYRKHAVQASIKETLAAGLVLLSYYTPDRLLIDPMCGAGTIMIEAALIARNIAPGLDRSFASEEWAAIDKMHWIEARQAAKDAIRSGEGLQIFGYDIDPDAIKGSKANARAAGVSGDILFEEKDIKDLWIDQQYGIIISNPPYGIKLGEYQELNQIYISIHKTLRNKAGWSLYILTADKKFPDYFKRAWPDRTRKLYNANIEVNYYQYYGERPPRQKS